MKGALALHLCLAVFAAFCDAPFVHFHMDGGTEHARQAHHGNSLSGHHHHAAAIAGAGSQIRALEGSDDDAVFLACLQAGPETNPIVTIALPVLTALMAPAMAVVISVIAAVPRSHDPPYPPSVRPRSPPPSQFLLAV